nr:hypothetical protein [Tanacetum cinerariifolium]
MVYALGDETSYIFPWGNNDIFVYRSFWLNLLGLKEGVWLSDRHLDAWFELMWSFRPTDADYAISNSYFCGFIMRGDIPGWVCNGVTYPVMWADVEQVFFSINEPKKHYCLGVLHIRTGVITLYDSLYYEVVETRKWWIKMRKAFKKYIPPYLQEWGILDAKGIPLESYNINFVVGKDVPRQGDAYRDCGVWVFIFLYRLIHKMVVSAKDPQIVGLAYWEHMFDYFWKYKIPNYRSFLRYMRPLIIINGVHLKGNYLGTNLLAVGMDGNNQIITLAIGVSQDRHATIIQAYGTVFDNLFHGFCDHYLMMNCNLKGKKLRGIFGRHVKFTLRRILIKQFPNYEPNQRHTTVRTNSLIRTLTREEHLSEEARLDEERLRNGQVYMDWDDVQASEKPVTTTEGIAVEDWQALLKKTPKRTKSDQNRTKTGSVAKPGKVRSSYSG